MAVQLLRRMLNLSLTPPDVRYRNKKKIATDRESIYHCTVVIKS